MLTHLIAPAFVWAALLQLGGAPLEAPEPAPEPRSTAPAATGAEESPRSPIERLLRRALGRPNPRPEERAPDPDDALDPTDPDRLTIPDLYLSDTPLDDPEEEP